MLICQKKGPSHHLAIIDITTPNLKEVEGTTDEPINKIRTSPTAPNSFIAQSDNLLHICQFTDGKFKVVAKVKKTAAYSLTSTHLATYDESNGQLKFINANTGQTDSTVGLGLLRNGVHSAPVREIHILESEGPSKQVLTVLEDCRVDLLDIPGVDADHTASLEWTRYEGLANISAVEMIDLPLSEAQARIESEFSLSGGEHLAMN